MGARIPLDDLAVERAAARLYALRFEDLDEGRAAWGKLLPSRRQALREEVRFARLWFKAIVGDEAASAELDPRIPALLCPRSAVRRRLSQGTPSISTSSAAAVDDARDHSPRK